MGGEQEPEGVNGKGWGRMPLYFGCRQRDVDELYKSELEQLINGNVINAVHVAFSREPGLPKSRICCPRAYAKFAIAS